MRRPFLSRQNRRSFIIRVDGPQYVSRLEVARTGQSFEAESHGRPLSSAQAGGALSTLRVLFVGNHQSSRKQNPSAGVFVDRQIASLRCAGIDAEYFDVGSGSPRALLRAILNLRRRVHEWRPDLVHAQYGAGVGLVAVSGGRPAVITFSGTDLHRGGGQIGLVRRVLGSVMSNIAAARASRVICVSDVLRKHLWFKRNSAVVIPRGVDLAFFGPGPRDEARATRGWALDVPVVLFAGGRDPVNKGLALAEETMVLVRRELPNAHLEVLRNVPPQDMVSYYRAADVLLFTSIREGSPNVVKEALACALPVVSVRVGDVAERLEGVEPSTVAEREPAALAKALVAILRNPRRSNGPSHVTRLSMDAVARRVIAVYEAVLAS